MKGGFLMKLNYMRRFSAYVSTFYYSKYITMGLGEDEDWGPSGKLSVKRIRKIQNGINNQFNTYKLPWTKHSNSF